MKRPFLLIGTCLRAHGIKGEVLTRCLTDDQSRFFEGLICYAMDDKADRPLEKLRLSACRPTPQGLLLSFDGIRSREEARRLAGVSLAVKREDALALMDDSEFYYGDLLGSQVTDERVGCLGQVTDIMNAGSGEILVVSKKGEKDLLIPFLRAIVGRVDTEENQILVRLPDGLYELYRDAGEGPGEP